MLRHGSGDLQREIDKRGGLTEMVSKLGHVDLSTYELQPDVHVPRHVRALEPSFPRPSPLAKFSGTILKTVLKLRKKVKKISKFLARNSM